MSVVPHSPNGTLTVGLTLIAQLEQAGALTEVGLNPDLFNATYDQCEALAAMMGRVNDITAFVIGDLIAYSERRFGEIAPQLALATRKSPQTLSNWSSISRRVPFERRVEGVKHSLHAEVAALPPAQQTKWLKTAKREGLERDELRARIRAEHSEAEPCVHEYVCRHCGQHGP